MTDVATIKIKKLVPNAILPDMAHSGDSGFDLYSVENSIVEARGRILVHTGIALAIPNGYEGCIRPRSGNALKLGYTVLNTPGTIDAGYRGEISVIIQNTTPNDIFINKGDRIAQLVIQKLPSVNFIEVKELDETTRGDNGFGSTGR